MKSINILGLKVVGITAAILIVVFGIYQGTKKLLQDNNSQGTAEQTDITPESSPLIDSDQDRLADVYEQIYNTDAANTDSDSDGTSDFDEILAGRDPTIPAPNDESRPPTGANVPALDTYTQRYLASLPEDVARDQILNKERIEAFIAANMGPLLPELAAGTIKTTQATGKDAIKTYLDSISSTHNTALHAITSADIEAAYRLHYINFVSDAINDIAKKLEENVSTLQVVASPEETVSLHTKLVQASQALVDNVKLLQGMRDDFIGGLIGAKKIEELGPVFQEIAGEVAGLEEKYGLE